MTQSNETQLTQTEADPTQAISAHPFGVPPELSEEGTTKPRVNEDHESHPFDFPVLHPRSPRREEMLRLWYGPKELTLKEVALRMGVTRQRIQQVVRRAEERLEKVRPEKWLELQMFLAAREARRREIESRSGDDGRMLRPARSLVRTRRAPYQPPPLTFEEMRAFVHSLHLATFRDWVAYIRGISREKPRRPRSIPSQPQWVFHGRGWSGWPDWLGVSSPPEPQGCRPFEEARAFARSLHFGKHTNWDRACRVRLLFRESLPPDIPAKPDEAYFGTGWLDWEDWYGPG